jgi:hypothetical protein
LDELLAASKILHEARELKNRIKDGMIQPPTIKIQWSTPNGCEMSCNISTDKGLLSPEYASAYTILDFQTKLLVQWDKDHKEDPDYLKKKA